MNANKRAIYYNESIGYRRISANSIYSNYELTEENYLLHSEKFKALIQSDTDRKIVIVIDDPEDPFEKLVLDLFNKQQKTIWDIELTVDAKPNQ